MELRVYFAVRGRLRQSRVVEMQRRLLNAIKKLKDKSFAVVNGADKECLFNTSDLIRGI
jgi:hypothetical protein